MSLSRRNFLIGSLVALGGAGAVGYGVWEGLTLAKRGVVPPRATTSPGISLSSITDGAAQVQVFFDPTDASVAPFAKATTGAFLSLVLSGKCNVIHQAHFTNDAGRQRALELACSDVVGHYVDCFTGTPFSSAEFDTLVNDKACLDFVSEVSNQARSLGVSEPSVKVYVNGTLVEMDADVNQYSDVQKLSAILDL